MLRTQRTRSRLGLIGIGVRLHPRLVTAALEGRQRPLAQYVPQDALCIRTSGGITFKELMLFGLLRVVVLFVRCSVCLCVVSVDQWIRGSVGLGSVDPWIRGSVDLWIRGSVGPWSRGSVDPCET